MHWHSVDFLAKSAEVLRSLCITLWYIASVRAAEIAFHKSARRVILIDGKTKISRCVDTAAWQSRCKHIPKKSTFHHMNGHAVILDVKSWNVLGWGDATAPWICYSRIFTDIACTERNFRLKQFGRPTYTTPCTALADGLRWGLSVRLQ